MTSPRCFASLSFVRLLAVAGVMLGAAGAASAQPAWLRNLNAGDHLLCCGPKGGAGYEDAVATPDLLAPRDVLKPVSAAAPHAIATVALGSAGGVTEVKPAVEPDVAGIYPVTFDHLSAFEFVAPPDETKAPEAEKQIPAPVRALDAKRVTVTGFMLPVKMDGGLVTEFLLVKDPMMCCYGVMPKVNEWVVVKMNGKGVAPLMDVPITFEGTLKVGQIYEGGYLTGLYLLQGDRRVETKG